MELFNYFRSSASYRVRIALALKGLVYDYRAVHLAHGEQFNESYAAISASRLVPMLQRGEHHLHQSLAIIEYLDETYPDPPLLPAEPARRAWVRALALDLACEVHPLHNLRVLQYLVQHMGADEDAKLRWVRHWTETGLLAVERQLAAHPALFCAGERPGLADCVLVPQIVSAQRFACRLDHLPHVMRVFETCMALEAFAATQPARCPDAE